ncbi:M23 family peptidase [Schaalia odontolytica]|uniref:M23 family peptidase n=1 Tax=Schaalia odontolytica TaxID=1660 RepID=A0A2I1HXY8_9ACTO|nr:M23 family peptidase [Schaalia odontolytica]
MTSRDPQGTLDRGQNFVTNTDKGESVSDTECPLPKRSQLRAARSENGDDSQENPITAAIPVGEETVAPPPPPAAKKTVEEPPASASSSETEPDADEGAPASSSSKRRRNVHPVGYALRALLVLGLAGTTIAVPMTGRVGSDSSLTVPARAFGASVGGPSWAVSSALPQATALDGTLTANSRAKAQAPVSITGCASGNGADGNRNVRVVADTIYWPLPQGTYTVTSPFTMRISPVSGQLLAHEGIDMAAPLDTPITSVYGGVVEEVAENSRSGAYVQIKHTKSDGTVFHSAYLHQYMNKIKVKVGDTVTAGQVIGAVGNNGWSTGPHLHFEIHDSSDTPVDPDAWMQANKAVYLGQESCS